MSDIFDCHNVGNVSGFWWLDSDILLKILQYAGYWPYIQTKPTIINYPPIMNYLAPNFNSCHTEKCLDYILCRTFKILPQVAGFLLGLLHVFNS